MLFSIEVIREFREKSKAHFVDYWIKFNINLSNKNMLCVYLMF